MSARVWFSRFASALASLALALAASPVGSSYAVEVSVTAPNDPRWSQQWALAAEPGIGIGVLEAWQFSRGETAVIAVVDSGVIAHPEFDGRVLPGYDFVSSVRVANDGDGRDPDASDPGSWVTEDDVASGNFPEDCKAENSDWHGTHVAGIALAAAGNGKGVAGVAPRAELLPVRVVGKCGGTERDLIDGMRWAVGLKVAGVPKNSRPADVINLSLGAERDCSPALQAVVDEITALDIAIVAAVGNAATDASRQSPAKCFGTVTVSALTAQGTLAVYSNYGTFVDLAAPGGDQAAGIISTVDRGTRRPIGPGFASYQGTSMAAPHLSGVLALARSYDPLTPFDAIYEVLFANLAAFRSSSSAYACDINLCGVGALDAGALLRALDSREVLEVERTLPSSVTLEESLEGTFTLAGERAQDVQVATPATCSYDGEVMAALARGECILTLERPGTATAKPVSYSASIQVTGRTPVIEHSLPAELRIGAGTKLNAIADSEGSLTYKSRTPEVCTVGRKGKVTGTKRGTCRIRISVAASGVYDAGRVVVITSVRR